MSGAAVFICAAGRRVPADKPCPQCGAGTNDPCEGPRYRPVDDIAKGPSREAPWTLADLRRANEARQAEWCPDQVPDLSFRGNELAGETGEACNVIKKLERERMGWVGSRASLDQLAEELADVVICADLAAMAAGVDLYAAVRAKFDATSRKVGLATRLSSESPHSLRRPSPTSPVLRSPDPEVSP